MRKAFIYTLLTMLMIVGLIPPVVVVVDSMAAFLNIGPYFGGVTFMKIIGAIFWVLFISIIFSAIERHA